MYPRTRYTRSSLPEFPGATIIAVTLAVLLVSAPSAFAQVAPTLRQPATASQSTVTRRLSVDDVVRLALEQNLGLQVARLNPQIQDIVISQVRSSWRPDFTSAFNTTSQNNPSTSALEGGQTKVTDSRFTTQVGVTQSLPTGANYSLSWNSFRATSSNIFSNFDPLLNSNLRLNVSQPLLRDFKIDGTRQQLEISLKERDASDLQLQSQIVLTTRNVKNAYWDLTYQIDNLKAVRESLELAQRVLSDNEKRVQVGTLAPIELVESQSEIARNEESVIVAEAAIEQAVDRLRALIFDPGTPDFWNIAIEPTDPAPFRAQALDVEAAVRRALDQRTDVRLARNSLARSDISIRYFRNQILPDVSAQFLYSSTAAGGVQLNQLNSIPIGETPERTVVAQRGFGSVLGDVLTGTYPTWTLGLSVSYPLGLSASEANLARARIQYSQAQTEMKNLDLQVAMEVRNVARQVQTNQKRVDSTRVARELAERRLDAAQKKFAAGIETNFFVFQAQRDLTQARTSEVRAISDYNRSLVDFEAVQEVSLGGGGSITTVR
jgi:HAE1 family hydrophobic/amphiphilic exporter-1